MLHWIPDNPSGMQSCQFKHLSVLILNCVLADICWFNIDEPGGDQTHDLQIEATPPVASWQARSLHATQIV